MKKTERIIFVIALSVGIVILGAVGIWGNIEYGPEKMSNMNNGTIWALCILAIAFIIDRLVWLFQRFRSRKSR